MEPKVTVRTTCRVCGSERLTPMFTLGWQSVSDFVPKDKVGKGVRCPIEMLWCEGCSLAQLKHTAPQELLYTRHYWYRSGVTQTMRNALEDVVNYASDLVDVERGDVVLDIGSNDGTLLRCYPTYLIRVGVEPADNLATKENYEGLELVHDFWPSTSGTILPHAKAKIVTALGMFYDLEDPNAFIADVARVLHKDGVFIAQLMCLKNMLNQGDIGNLCHEHLEYYSLRSLSKLLGNHGLTIADISKVPVNGESYRLTIRHDGCERSPLVTYYMMAEDHIKNDLAKFFIEAEANKNDVIHFIRQEVARGKKVWVYGASTKGNVILQYYGLDSRLIEGAADRSPEKHGLYTIATGIPIHSEEYARAQSPDYFLVLPYAFIEEFKQREAVWYNKGGRFILPLPKLRIV